MSDDLVKRLRESDHFERVMSAEEAADRIEQLEAKLTACEKYRNAYAECDRIGTQSVRELEAKLAKAVSALELIAQPKVGPDFDWSHDEVNRWRDRWYRKYQNIARTTLAELTGGKDE